MAFPEIALVPWNTTTNKAQPGFVGSKEPTTIEWNLLSFNGRQTAA